ncbi:PilW family protein [Fastidiosibacter lacustris]|uniref:PilW family protein n=1 Tax=Fastidiosibacter lacustris TaxID=2056695 RepID=UPI000E34E0BE|nr:hypothetical protein [Fastidiosibacter lacustris]
MASYLKKLKKQQGASLIQVLIGISVGAFVLVIAAEMYFTVRNSYTRTVTQMTDNTRANLVSQVIRNTIDKATSLSPFGIWPWQQVDVRTLSFNPLVYPPIYAATLLNFYNPPNQVLGTHILMLQSMVSSQFTTSGINQGDNPIPTTLAIGKNDFVLLADQAGYQVMKATANASGSLVSVEQGPARSYAINSFLAQYHVYIFYLRELNGVRSLMLNVDGESKSDEVIRNVEDFQIRYFINGAWRNIDNEGTPGYLNSWYKETKGIEIQYQINAQQYTLIIALKPNLL